MFHDTASARTLKNLQIFVCLIAKGAITDKGKSLHNSSITPILKPSCVWTVQPEAFVFLNLIFIFFSLLQSFLDTFATRSSQGGLEGFY